ncbi:transmembrane 6 superfamily member 1 [Plakobranchus ocellatus]|uniref:Transmembrane 6 superfamily member 1 n=1 Tax=Plakobranchus ocellatus TaxID=259542 RepID=A0AAV3Z7W9_9GAST|nr:transmembrane 6 superfamily member 1 [Plakobranchus ocellatus]
MSAKYVVLGVSIMSLLSWPILVALDRLNIFKSERSALLAGLALILVALLLTILLFRRFFKRVDPFVYIFSLLCYDALPGLVLVLELDGYIPSFNATTLATGVEPLMKTSHGVVSTYWNGTAHLILYLAAIALYVRRDSHREVTLFWAGSLLNMYVVLMPALVTQTPNDKSAIYLNAPIIVLPILAIGYYMHRRPVQARSFLEAPKIWKRPVDLLFFMYFLLSATFVVFRGMAVLGGKTPSMKDYLKDYEPYLKDSQSFPKFQHWMADWSLVHGGAAAQAQFTYIAGALNKRTSANMRPAMTGVPGLAFWSINILMLVVPQLFALWCLRDPENHGRTYTVDLATPKYLVGDIVRKPARIYHKKEWKLEGKEN